MTSITSDTVNVFQMQCTNIRKEENDIEDNAENFADYVQYHL